MTTQQPQAENGGLKRLQPVLQAAEKGAQTAGAIYSATKERLPQSVKPRVEQLESSLSAAAAEPLHKAQDTGAQQRDWRRRRGQHSVAGKLAVTGGDRAVTGR